MITGKKILITGGAGFIGFALVERISNIEKAQRMLGYDPKIDLDEGLRKAIKWYRRRENGKI